MVQATQGSKVHAVAIVMNIAEAKAKLSSLVERALAGEDVTIARAGRPAVRLVPAERREPRRPGLARHWPRLTAAEEAALLEPMSEEDLAEMEAEWDELFGPAPTGDADR